MGAALQTFDGNARGTPLPDGRGAGVRVCGRFSVRDGATAVLNPKGRPSSLPFSHTGEGFPALYDERCKP